MIARVILSMAVMAALLLTCTATTPAPAQNRYEPNRGSGSPSGSKHLHRVPLTSTGVHAGSLLPLGPREGAHRRRRDADNARDRRQVQIQWYSAFSPELNGAVSSGLSSGLSGGIVGIPSFSSFQQYQQYQVSSLVPVYIPVWGSPQRIPVFFPTKPILFNPGYPNANPPAKPAEPPSGQEGDKTDDGSPVPTFENRFGENEDGPSWGIVEDTEAARPPPSTTFRPPSGRTQPPPIFRKPQASRAPAPPPAAFELNPQRPIVEQTVQQAAPVRPSQSRPPTSGGGSFGGNSGGSGGSGDSKREPDRCVWAIVSCCKPSSPDTIKYSCFEQLGCSGSFWGTSPCSREITKAAIRAVEKFYDQS